MVGEDLVVPLGESPSTGYAWSVISPTDTTVLTWASEYIADEPVMPGSGGTRVYTFTGAAPGTDTIELHYARSWETDPPLETYLMNVTVVPAEDTGEPPAPLYTVAEGIWDGRSYATIEDSCNLETLWDFDEDTIDRYEVEHDGDTINFTSAGRVTWTCTQAEGTNDLNCEAPAEIDFSAGMERAGGVSIPAGLDATLMLTSRADSTITSDTTVAGYHSEWTGTCEGRDCAEVVELAGITAEPCSTFIESWDMQRIDHALAQDPGEYLMDAFTWSEDDCDLADNIDFPGFSATTLSLSSAFDDYVFVGTEIVSAEDGVTFACAPNAFSSLNWTCEREVLRTVEPEMPISHALVTLHVDMTKRTFSPTRFWPTIRVEATCSGVECIALSARWGISGFPCSAWGTSTANLIED